MRRDHTKKKNHPFSDGVGMVDLVPHSSVVSGLCDMDQQLHSFARMATSHLLVEWRGWHRPPLPVSRGSSV